MTKPDSETLVLFSSLFGFLSLASIIGLVLRGRVTSEAGKKTVANLNARIFAWWIMVALFGGAVLAGRLTTVVLFALMSFLALREFITLTPSRRGDHRALFQTFFVLLPLHYVLLGMDWYGLFSIMIPVYGFLAVPVRIALAGDSERFLERTAKIQWGLVVCVYFLSHAPALLNLTIHGYAGENAKLLLYLVCIVQMSDVLQYVWGKLCGRRPIAPKLSPSKTIEGFIGGALTTIALGAALHPITPFNWWQSALFSAVIVLMGFLGGLVMSAVKRDRGVKDYGELLPGHGGMMDRIDSLCFAAPVFFHLVRYYFT